MVDALFEHPRLVAIYDALHPDRDDLDAYVGIVDELGARSVLDIGCGTGTFALLLADRGIEVVGLDPAAGSLAVARAKPGADRVQWVHGDATSLPPMEVDLAIMTGNVSQAIVNRPDWEATLRAASPGAAARRPPGARDPRPRLPGLARVEPRRVVPEHDDRRGRHGRQLGRRHRHRPDRADSLLVSFRWTYVFAADGCTLTSRLDAALPRAGRGRGRLWSRTASPSTTCAMLPTGPAASSCSSPAAA